ncbi:MAG: hypothetical protein KDA61_15730 [Planctomycetales bacterium]|nr:hypothetical protein [Planctomycetales bacterium]
MIAPPTLLVWADDVLRRCEWTTRAGGLRTAIPRMAACLVASSAFYGAVMGTFRLWTGQTQWQSQVAYSAAKVPLLLTSSFALNIPAFYVLCSLAGLGRDFPRAVRALLAAQTGLALTLASLSPLTLLWYASTNDYASALRFNGLMFATAAIAAQYLLRGYYRPLMESDARHAALLRCWAGLYALVAVQLAWLLRPFIGSAQQPVEFLRAEAWDNAYLRLGKLLWDAFG